MKLSITLLLCTAIYSQVFLSIYAKLMLADECQSDDQCSDMLQCTQKHKHDAPACDCNTNLFYELARSCYAGEIGDPCSGYNQCRHRGLKCLKDDGQVFSYCRCESKHYFDTEANICKRSLYGKPCGVKDSCDGYHTTCTQGICNCTLGTDGVACIAPPIDKEITCFTYNDCDTTRDGYLHTGYTCSRDKHCFCSKHYIEVVTAKAKDCTKAATKLQGRCSTDEHCRKVIQGSVICARETGSCQCSSGYRGTNDQLHCLKEEDYIRITLWRRFWKQVTIYATKLYYRMSVNNTFFNPNVTYLMDKHSGVIPADLSPSSVHGIAFDITHSLTTGSPSFDPTNYTQHGELTIKTTPAISPATHATPTTPTYTEESAASTSSLTEYTYSTTSLSTTSSPSSTTTGSIGQNAITNPEWKCEFEVGSTRDDPGKPTMCGTVIDSVGSSDWRWEELKTGASKNFEEGYYGTGTDHGFNATGYYMHVLAVNKKHHNGSAVLFLPPLHIPGEPKVCLKFAYHMSGLGMGSLSVYNSREWLGEHKANGKPVFSISGDQGNKWKMASVNFDFKQGDKVTFVASSAITGWKRVFGDMAVDHLSIKQGLC